MVVIEVPAELELVGHAALVGGILTDHLTEFYILCFVLVIIVLDEVVNGVHLLRSHAR